MDDGWVVQGGMKGYMTNEEDASSWVFCALHWPDSVVAPVVVSVR